MTRHLSIAGTAGGNSRRNSFRHKPDGKLDPAGEVGWYLQYERERRGETLADAAVETRIKATYLHALEQGALDQLPGWPYSLGFVRGYAKFLGLEPEPLVEHYATFIGKPAVIDRVGSRSMWWRRSTSVRSAAAMVGLVSVSVIGFWAMFQEGPMLTAKSGPTESAPLQGVAQLNDADPLASGDPLSAMGSDVAENVESPADAMARGELAGAKVMAMAGDEPVPDVTGSLAPTPRTKPSNSVAFADRMAALDAAVPTVRVKQKTMAGAVRGSSASGVGQSDVETALAIDGTAPEQTKAPSDLTKLIASALKGEAGDGTPKDAVTTIIPAGADLNGATTNQPERAAGLVRLRARDNVWMRVEDRSGEVLISQTLARGETYEVPKGEGLVLIVRDAGALEYSVGSKPFATLGQPGQILVSHPLDAGRIGLLEG